MGRPRKNPGMVSNTVVTPNVQPSENVTVTTTEPKVEVIREAHDPKYVAGIQGKIDRYQAGVNKAVNLNPGDVPHFAIAKEGQDESAEAAVEQYGAYKLVDKNGKEIRHKELIAMGVPKSEFDIKKAREMAQTAGYKRKVSEDARREGVFERENRTNKKYFNG